MKRYTLRRPEWLTLTIGGKPHCGYDQEWYPDPWQQKAGCGPTTGAAIAAYIEAKTRGIRPADKEAALAKMQAFWPYAAPRRHGLYKTRWLMEGLAAYLRDQGLPGRADMFSVPLLRPLRRSAEETAAFVGEGLAADAPLGFLNLHNGGNEAIYSWHWMPLVSLSGDGGQWEAEALDEGKVIAFDLSAWLRNTKFGGGFVRVMDTDQ